MASPYRSDERDIRVVVMGGLLILLVAGYFIARAIFFQADPEEVTLKELEDSLSQEAKTALETISSADLRQKLLNGEKLVLVDIRPAEAYEEEHIPQSLSYPGSSVQNYSPAKDETPVIVFSAADASMLETANNILKQKSFKTLFLESGFESWKKDGYPTLSYGNPSSFVDQSKVTYIAPGELKTLLEKGDETLYLLDVQSKEKYAVRHLKGAANIPLAELEKRKEEIPTGKSVVVYGENETISFRGGVRLHDLNFFAVRTLSGNFHLEPKGGLPYEP